MPKIALMAVLELSMCKTICACGNPNPTPPRKTRRQQVRSDGYPETNIYLAAPAWRGLFQFPSQPSCSSIFIKGTLRETAAGLMHLCCLDESAQLAGGVS